MAFDENANKFESILKPYRKNCNFLEQALKEVCEEEAERNKKSAKELIRKAINLQKLMIEIEKNCEEQKKNIDKELGQILEKIKFMAAGKSSDTSEIKNPESDKS